MYNEWKTVKTKSKNNANIASPSSVSPKILSPLNLQNGSDHLIVTKGNQIETHEPQHYTLTNHNKCCEIANAKPKVRAEKINLHSIRPSNAKTVK